MLDALFGGSSTNKKQQQDEPCNLVTQARDERAALSAMLIQMAARSAQAVTPGPRAVARRDRREFHAEAAQLRDKLSAERIEQGIKSLHANSDGGGKSATD